MIICLIIAIILVIAWIVFTILGFKEDINTGGAILVAGLVLVGIIDFILLSPFVALDRSSGSTIGIITAVDKNFFGTTSIYIKTAENNEDKYCVENKKVIKQAKELIGEKVQLYYGERVGLYHLNQCKSAPIEEIKMKGDK